MANKCKCGNTESYNFALDIGRCNPCIGERLEELEKKLKTWHSPENLKTACRIRNERITELEAKIKRQDKNIDARIERLFRQVKGILQERIKKLEAHLMNINNCVAIIANDEVVRTSKELPKILANLEKYIKDALKGK